MRRRALLSSGKKDYSQDYFTMVVTAGGDITWKSSTTDNILYYSKDNGTTWTATDGTAISVTSGDKILWKGTPTPKGSGTGIGSFDSTSKVKYYVEGNIMSLLFGDDFKGKTSLERKKYAFSRLFNYSWNYSITGAENLSLPATYLE